MTTDSAHHAYSRPPILEAVVEIRYADQANLSRVAKASDRIAKRYDTVTAEQQVEATMNFGERSAEFREVSPLYRHTSLDQVDVVALRNGSVIWSRLAPYSGWAEIRARVSTEMDLLHKGWGARSISRLGLRYINRLDVPRSDDSLFHNEHYLNYRLEVGPLLDPQNGYQWLTRRVHADRAGLVSIVQSAVIEPEIPETMAFTFDIDVSADVDVPQKHDDILTKLDEMRQLKNEIFEAGITPLARRAFA
ncbi:TIGR04255 family protein [Sphingomonas sp. PWP1-2]|uniref:TIGR04255 family protein n=1 Tax=Sphingomonas sp. PWP1-2 TaxID=2804558 RepID=UPI003CEC4872